MKKFLITLICGVISQVCFTFGWVIGLIFMLTFKLNFYWFIAITAIIMAIGVAIVILGWKYGYRDKNNILLKMVGLEKRNTSNDGK